MRKLALCFLVMGIVMYGLENIQPHSNISLMIAESLAETVKDPTLLHTVSDSSLSPLSPHIGMTGKVGLEDRLHRTLAGSVTLADGLESDSVAQRVNGLVGQFIFWPNEQDPTHLIVCMEGSRKLVGTDVSGDDTFNASVQRLSLSNNISETILRGLDRCDVIERTPWGTVLAAEEVEDGSVYEILRPLLVTNHVVQDRSRGHVTNRNDQPSAFVAKRPALPIMAWEGLAVLENGAILGIEEKHTPNIHPRQRGGVLFKFIPAHSRVNGAVIENLDESPLVAGRVNAMQVYCQHGTKGFDDSRCSGMISWLSVRARNASHDAFEMGTVGYRSPEDLYLDTFYKEEGSRFCWTSLTHKDVFPMAQVHCAIDYDLLGDEIDVQGMVATNFLKGNPLFRSHDGTIIHPETEMLLTLVHGQDEMLLACGLTRKNMHSKTSKCTNVLTVPGTLAELKSVRMTKDGKTVFLALQKRTTGDPSDVDNFEAYEILKVGNFSSLLFIH